MKAEIISLHSPDIHNLEEFQPEQSDNFGFLLQIIISPKGVEGGESFDTIVCTPKWLLDQHDQNEILFGRQFIIVFKYDYIKLHEAINKYIQSIEGNDWDDIAKEMCKIGKWEFENYH